MSERSKEHASKACEVKASASSNLALSAFGVPGLFRNPFCFCETSPLKGYKEQFFHMRSFKGVTIDGFTKMLDEYMVWYRDKRIKLEYGMSIMGKRIELGLVA